MIIHLYTIFPVKCSNPLDQSESRVIVMVDGDPPLEGTNITFSCPPELILTGPGTSTCMGNGEWEPDPREVACIHKGIFFFFCYTCTHKMQPSVEYQ